MLISDQKEVPSQTQDAPYPTEIGTGLRAAPVSIHQSNAAHEQVMRTVSPILHPAIQSSSTPRRKREATVGGLRPEVKTWMDSVIIPILLTKFRREIQEERAA
jgi:hypothetical protein